MAGKSDVKHHLVLLAKGARDISTGRSERRMDSLNLKPRYSTSQIPGNCIKCLAEQELNNCLPELLRGEGEEKELQQRFEMLPASLKSPESQKLRDESERYLAEGKNVGVKINFETDKPEYELKID